MQIFRLILGRTAVAVPADTSALESALEKASSDLAELQSRLASEQAAAETDPGAVTEEERKKWNSPTICQNWIRCQQKNL